MPARAGDSSTTGSAGNTSASPGSRPRRVSKRCTRAAIRASTTPTSSSVGGARGRKPSVSPSPSAKKTPAKSSVWKWMFRSSRRQSADDRHRSRPPVADPVSARAVALEAQQDPHGHAEHGTRQRVIPRQEIAKTERQAQHLLAHGHPRQHLVDEAGSALGHAPAAAARAEPRPLLENGTSRSNAQSLHRRRAKPYASTPQVRKSCFHRSGR